MSNKVVALDGGRGCDQEPMAFRSQLASELVHAVGDHADFHDAEFWGVFLTAEMDCRSWYATACGAEQSTDNIVRFLREMADDMEKQAVQLA